MSTTQRIQAKLQVILIKIGLIDDKIISESIDCMFYGDIDKRLDKIIRLCEKGKRLTSEYVEAVKEQ